MQILIAEGVILANIDYIIYTVPPISNEKILPNSKPTKWELTKRVSIFISLGEYEPTSLVIFAKKTLKDVKVKVVDLRPEIKVDIRIVKCWYQAGRTINDVKHKMLVPELLLHDDGLVRVDYARKQNLVRRENLQDAKELLPFFVPKGKLRQLWLTFFASEVCLLGNYKGKVVITAQNTLPQEIELEVKVLPIKLLPPLLDYAIYYRGKLKEVSYSPEIGSEWKTKKQMEAELEDMKSHGIDNPTVYQPFVQRENGSYGLHLLREVIEIRKKIGITGKPLLYLGLGTGAPQQSEELEVLKKKS